MRNKAHGFQEAPAVALEKDVEVHSPTHVFAVAMSLYEPVSTCLRLSCAEEGCWQLRSTLVVYWSTGVGGRAQQGIE